MNKLKDFLYKFTVIFIILGIASLASLGYLEPAIKFLKSSPLTIDIGSFKLSAHSVIKAILAAIVIFSVATIFSNFVEGRIRKLRRMNFSNRQLLIKSTQIVIYVVAFLVILRVVGVDLKALAIFSGAIGIGLGFGLQKISSNFISGIILLFEKTIKKDDLIEIANNEVRGFVKKIRARYILIETLDNKEVMVPNEDLITQRVTNCTYSNKMGRVHVDFGVSYSSDVHQVKDLAIEAARSTEKCIDHPEPKCCLTEFGDSSINFRIYFWLENISSGLIFAKSDVMFAIWDKLKENNIEIPFPQRDINFKNAIQFEKKSNNI